MWEDGRVWFIALALKARDGRPSVGSNPTLLANSLGVVTWLSGARGNKSASCVKAGNVERMTSSSTSDQADDPAGLGLSGRMRLTGVYSRENET